MMFAESLSHRGTPHEGMIPHSGRYKWGSGDNGYQRSVNFKANVEQLKRKGFDEKEIVTAMGLSSTKELRDMITISTHEIKAAEKARAVDLYNGGKSKREIASLMGKSEGTIRNLLKEDQAAKETKLDQITDVIRKNVDKKKMVDIGVGVERELTNSFGFLVSKERLRAAKARLKEEGYEIHNIQVDQLGTNDNKTTIQVLTVPGVSWAEVVNNKEKIKPLTNYEVEIGKSALNLEPVQSISSKRVLVRYAEEGGKDKDGVIELRRGVDDLSLGYAKYAQVRIGVDDTHFLKGMAIYTDEKLPPGIDVVFNTNKSKDTPMLGPKDNSVLKPMHKNKDGKIDQDNPFKATIKNTEDLKLVQKYYLDKDGNKKISAINIVNEEGDWSNWKKTLASQVLSKQDSRLAKTQLKKLYDDKVKEFNEINELTNPMLKKRLLMPFADSCDSSASDLKAAALPRQASHVILPLTSIKKDEIYAPKYNQGEHVVLIRYPHGGRFEIPELKVNNKNKEALSIMKNATDAVGIHSSVAEQLSGADFDGDTVLVIPVNDRVKIKRDTSKVFDELKTFDPKSAYPKYEGMEVMTSGQKGQEMGKVTNLITDMTIKGASPEEIVRAVKHSMVVIDAEKHELNWKLSEERNGIRALKVKYQGGTERNPKGASTIISRAGAEARVPARKEITNVRKMTPAELKAYREGRIVYRDTGDTLKNGKPRTIKTTQMDTVDDARELISDKNTTIERVYADHANSMKALANQARKEYRSTPDIKYNASAAKTYKQEVDSLKDKLDVALRNAPRERYAQLSANVIVASKKRENPDMDNDDLKKIKAQALNSQRARFNAKKQSIPITDREWEAIQSNAISATRLKDILNNTDLDELKKRATPKASSTISSSTKARIKSMNANGLSLAEIAERLNISTSSVSNVLNE